MKDKAGHRATLCTSLRNGAMAIQLLFVVAGCSQSPIEFGENRLAMEETQLIAPHRQQIAAVLTELFGTPDAPHAPAVTELDDELLRMAAGPAGYIREEGPDNKAKRYQQRGLYRQHCASCHGIAGDGAGPAAAVLATYARDFRSGIFKFKSTYHAAAPTDKDLHKVLDRGVPGTAMPSFALLSEQQTDSLVEYVKYLAIRGQVEHELIAAVADEFEFDPTAQTTDDPLDPQEDEHDRMLVNKAVEKAAKRWLGAEQQVVKPDSTMIPSGNRNEAEVAQSTKRGRELFMSPRAKCTDCHGAPGKGVTVKDYDDWNAAVREFQRKTGVLDAAIERRRGQQSQLSEEQRKLARAMLANDQRRLRRRQEIGALMLEPQPARPRDFSSGAFRGGSEPIDVFLRIHQGIPGTPMPGHGSPRPGAGGALSEAEIWALVDYLRSRQATDSL